MRKKYLYTLILLCVFFPRQSLGEQISLRFFHVNDIYQIQGSSPEHGGFAEIKNLINENQNEDGYNIVTFGGDFYPTFLGLTKISMKLTTKLLSDLGVELAVLGNHEFDKGVESAKNILTHTSIRWLCTNIRYTQTNKPFCATKYIKKVGPLKIGFFGLTTPLTPKFSTPGEKIKFNPIIETAERIVKELKKEGADVIVALTHQRFSQDQALAKSVPEINLILGGHDHHPISFMEGSTLIHKSGMDVEYLGVVDLLVDKTPSKLTVTFSWRMLHNYRGQKDRRLAQTITKLDAELGGEMKIIIGKTLTPLNSKSTLVRSQETAFGNLITDALRNHMKADVAIYNGGGIRGNQYYAAGTHLRVGNLKKELPYNNVTVRLNIKGKTLKKVIEHGLASQGPNPRFLQISGMKVVYDRTKPTGHRINKIQVGGNNLKLNKVYTLAIPSFLASGGDGFKMLKAAAHEQKIREGNITSDVVIQFIKERGEIAPKLEGRLVSLNN